MKTDPPDAERAGWEGDFGNSGGFFALVDALGWLTQTPEALNRQASIALPNKRELIGITLHLDADSDDVNGPFRRDANKSERSDAGICNDA